MTSCFFCLRQAQNSVEDSRIFLINMILFSRKAYETDCDDGDCGDGLGGCGGPGVAGRR